MELDNDLEKITPITLNTITFGGTGGIIVPSGNTAQRPTGELGLLRHNTDTGMVETYNSALAGYVGITDVLSIRSSVAATGTNLATATGLLPGTSVVISSTPVTAIGVSLPNGVVGMKIVVINSSPNTISVFPQASHTIDALIAGVAILLVSDGQLEFTCNSSTSWITNSNSVQDLTYTTGTLSPAQGGTGLTSLGTSLQVLRTNAAATATEWATISGGGGGVTGKGTTVVNFGTFPSSKATTTVTGIASIPADAIVTATIHSAGSDGDRVLSSNVLPFSNALDNPAYWTTNNCNVVINTALAEPGTIPNGWTLEPIVNTSPCSISTEVLVDLVDGNLYSFGVFVKGTVNNAVANVSLSQNGIILSSHNIIPTVAGFANVTVKGTSAYAGGYNDYYLVRVTTPTTALHVGTYTMTITNLTPNIMTLNVCNGMFLSGTTLTAPTVVNTGAVLNSLTHSDLNHQVLPCKITTSNVVAGVGFDVTVIPDFPVRGQFNIDYVWS